VNGVATSSLGERPKRAMPAAQPPPAQPPADPRPQRLGEVPRARGRDLSAVELEAFVRELADRPELWIDFVRHDASQRVYEELLSDAHLTAWLICWMDDQDTGFHDHDVSAGAVAVVSGRVREERLAVGGRRSQIAQRPREFTAGQAFHFAPSDIHRVRHGGGDPAITLHVYSPPLARMGAYTIADDGVLQRRAMPSSQELRPQEEREEAAPAARRAAA
jgi:predicted metal-dependent enzyme (double-stranded beta helix superfamily)